MGYKLINYIEAVSYNTKRFFLDNGAIDLPPIINKVDIAPGSEAHDINTMDMWVLNSNYEWELCPWKDKKCGGGGKGVPDAPSTEKGAEYVRRTNNSGINEWEKVKIIPEVPEASGKAYIRQSNGDGTFSWIPGVEEAPSTTPGTIYGRTIDDAGNPYWAPIDAKSIKAMTAAAWRLLGDKPDYTEITDGVYDGTITSNMNINDFLV